MANRIPRKYLHPKTGIRIPRVAIRSDLRRWFYFLPLIVCPLELTLSAQTLLLSSASASRGAPVAIEISLVSPPGKAPVALQWETIIPMAELSLIDKDIAIGPTAQKAGKSVACAVKGKPGETLTSVCILAGGQEQIQNGVIAVLRLKVSPEAPIGHTQIRVERGIAVARDATEVPMRPVKTVVSVRAK